MASKFCTAGFCAHGERARVARSGWVVYSNALRNTSLPLLTDIVSFSAAAVRKPSCRDYIQTCPGLAAVGHRVILPRLPVTMTIVLLFTVFYSPSI